MPGPKRTLRQVQRWMQTVLMHPGGVTPGVESQEARRYIDVSAEEVEQVITRSRKLPALDRLAIYSRAYYARLLECLHEEFPVLAQAVSEEVFDAFALEYLRKYPSRSYTLNQLGTRFPRFLAETRPEPGEGEGPSAGWPDFLIDLATLELTFNEVFDGPGAEGEALLDTALLLAVPERRWPEVRLLPVPCLRLLVLRYPVHEYYAAVRRKEEPSPPGLADTFLAVTRRDFVVRHYPLARPEYELLQPLAAGRPVGEAIERAVPKIDLDFDQLAERLRAWFARWAGEGFFRAVELAD